MSTTETHRSASNRPNDGDRVRNANVVRPTVRETKASTKTTELWLTLAGVALLAVIYNVATDASLNLFRVCLLGTIMAAAYIVSRGFAKAGSSDHDGEVDRYGRQV